MKSHEIKKYKIPNTPGVYFFRGVRGKILYIGKATTLRSRVYSYFTDDILDKRSPLIAEMVEKVREVTWQETDSVLEAIILEVNLIKKHNPKYNTKEKDDKSFNYVVITKEDFPRVLLIRAKELFGRRTSKKTSKNKYNVKYMFGPFPQGTVLRDALKIVRKIFPFRDKCLPASADSSRKYERTYVKNKPCFNRQIKLCPGVCSGEISKKEYAKIIQNIRLFFGGKKSSVIKKLQKEMTAEAKRLDFERAGEIKKTIFALEHIQDIALIKNERHPLSLIEEFRIEAYDVAHISGKFAVGVMTVVKGGEIQRSDYRKFKIKSFEGVNDTRALAEILERRLTHNEWILPRLVVVDGGNAQKNTAERVLKASGVMIPVVGVVKDERHKPKNIMGKIELIQMNEKDILLANSEAHRFAIAYHKQLRGKLK